MSTKPGSPAKSARGSSPDAKRKGAKKGGKEPAAAAAEADTTASSLIAEMETRIKQLQDELATEKRQRNYFQLQGEKLNEFWDITKRELEEVKALQRMREREMEDMEERHQVEVKVLQQQAKHLMIEHGGDVARLKTEAEAQLKVQDDGFGSKEWELKDTIRKLLAQLREQQKNSDEMVASLKVSHEHQLTKLRGEFEERCKELEARYDRRVKEVREEMDLRRQAEVREVEERKNAHINDLIRRHERSFQEMKSYYNDIFVSTADQIKTLGEQLHDVKGREQEKEKLLKKAEAENRKLAVPLERTQSQVAQLETKVIEMEKERGTLQASKARLKTLEEQVKALQWENEVLLQRYERVEHERDELYAKFMTTIRDVQQKGSFRSMKLEQRVTAFREAVEAKDAQLKEVVRAANLDPVSAATAQRQVEQVIEEKNAAVRELQYELAKLSKSHTDMLRVYESKLAEHGVPSENLGFKPATPSTSTPGMLVTQ